LILREHFAVRPSPYSRRRTTRCFRTVAQIEDGGDGGGALELSLRPIRFSALHGIPAGVLHSTTRPVAPYPESRACSPRSNLSRTLQQGACRTSDDVGVIAARDVGVCLGAPLRFYGRSHRGRVHWRTASLATHRLQSRLRLTGMWPAFGSGSRCGTWAIWASRLPADFASYGHPVYDWGLLREVRLK